VTTAIATPISVDLGPPRRRAQADLAFRALSQNRLAMMGLAILGFFGVLAAFAPWIVPFDPIAQNIQHALEPPSWSHPLGLDSFGRDLFSRVVYGGRLSLSVAAAPVVMSLAVGLPAGLLAGYFGGSLDTTVMRLADAMLSFPAILLAIAIMGSLGPSAQNVVFALTVVYAPVFARLVRGSTVGVRVEDYITAARAIGVSDVRIAFVHILPNVVGPLTVQVTATFSTAIVAESTLSFLGLGSQPPTPSWGLILNEGRNYLLEAPGIALAACVAITLAVLAVNFVGDGLRDALDPQFRTG
jgi:peptide/nickel transport system permease protein